jgi:4-hydroxybenzoate polyprenyltransferase
MKLKPIPDWRKAPRLYSIWALASIASIQGSVLSFLTPMQLAAMAFSGWTWGEVAQGVVAFLAVTGGIGRLLTQDLGD